MDGYEEISLDQLPPEEKKKRVYDYVRQKMDGQYSDANRAAKVAEADAYDSSGGMRLAEAFSGLGQAFQMKGGARTGGIDTSYFDNAKKENRDRTVGEFDRQKEGVFKEFQQDQALNKAEREAERNDPESDFSKRMVEVTEKQIPSIKGKLTGMSAAAIEKSLPRIYRQLEAQEQREWNSEEKRLDRKSRADIAQMNKADKNPNGLTFAQKKVDEKYADSYNKFTDKGMTNARSALDRLKEYHNRLIGETKEITEESGGRFATMLPDALRSRQAIEYRDQIGLAANKTLKELFGGQLSDAEREAAVREFYNDALPAEKNVEILGVKIKELEDNLANQVQKAKYYEKNGTLAGWEGSESKGTQKKEITEDDIDNMSIEELKAAGLI